MNPSTWFNADGDRSFRILWEDGERIFCRGHRRSADGDRDTVLAVLPAAEHPTPASLDRLAHEYGLKDELDAAWALRPLELVRERGRTMLVLEDPGGEPLGQLLGAPLELGRFLRFAIAASPTRTSSRPTSSSTARRATSGSPGSASPRGCSANGRRQSRPRPSPALSPTWRPNRPGG